MPIFNPNPYEIVAFITIAVTGLTGSIFVARAFTSAPTQLIAPIHYVQILWGIALGILLFGEYPDIPTLIGGAVIVLAGLLLIRYSRTI